MSSLALGRDRHWSLLCFGHAVGLRQALAEDPDELRSRRRALLGPRVRHVVLHGRVRQAEPVGGCLLRPCNQDRFHHPDLTVVARPAGVDMMVIVIGEGGAVDSPRVLRLRDHVNACRLAAASHSWWPLRRVEVGVEGAVRQAGRPP